MKNLHRDKISQDQRSRINNPLYDNIVRRIT